ncbi:hypothetical protein BV25DRAFT_385522 [Artomyces pyxidatus]|uniref:Uncharacterized protein n=1 Tax=Artomyces pyxidatus TaxID=48021 RepID=A0ACB8T4Y0_9AGAM|nr:hypothetical protein BV25DRAFT_385522 [Artomyces pyxidatus]
MEECLAELEADPDLADPTIISELRALLSKARSERSDDRQPTPLREKTPASVSLSSASKPTIPAGLTISEVHIESRNEGSSNESSDDDDANESTKDPSVREPSPDGLLFEEKLAALLQGPERRGPRKSVLDEIPSDSHSDEESEKEDILLDEEEDLRTQLSRRRSKAFAREKSSSQEPDVVGLDGDADEGSKSVFMDHSQELPPYEQITSPDPDENPDGPPIDVAVAQSSRDRTLAPAGDEVEDVSLSIENELEQTPAPSNVQVPGGGAARGLLGSGFQRLASPESDATAINTEPGKSPSILSFHHTETPTSADTNQRILVPATPDNKPHHPASEPGRPAISATPIHRAAEDHAGATRGDDVESIQSADDLVERYEADGEDDPIEEASPPVSRAGQSPLTPGVVKRMKTGAKKSAHPEKELPVPTSLPSDSEKGPDTTPDDATPLPPRKSSRLPRQATAGPEPAPSPPPAPVPKKRGRKPLPEEEKARRAAAKQAEKEEKARVREEKARIAREAREKKAAEKRASMPPPKSVRSTKPIPSASNAEEKSTAKPAAAYQASQADLSQAEWAILSPGPQGQHSESSAVDELGPSSPDPGTGGKIVDLRPSSDAEAGSSTATHTKLPARMQLDDLDQGDIDASQGSTQSLSQEPLPLFYPGSSQFPQLNQSQTSPASPEPVDSDSDEEPLVAKARGPSTATTPYRRLTEIASQDGLFPTGSARTTPATVGQRTSHAGRVKGLLSQMDDDEESTTTESESDSDGTPSHIPRSRMAGKAQKTKKSGLLSFA